MTQAEIRAEIQRLETEISDILVTDFMVIGDNPIEFVQKMVDDRRAKIEELEKRLV